MICAVYKYIHSFIHTYIYIYIYSSDREKDCNCVKELEGEVGRVMFPELTNRGALTVLCSVVKH